MKGRKTTVVGFLGIKLDRGGWDRWRPTVDVCRQDDLLVDRFHLLCPGGRTKLTRQIERDIASVSPGTEVICHGVHVGDAWDFEEVYGVLHDFARAQAFDPEDEDVLVHISTGTHVAQICLFLLTEAGYLPGRLLQMHPPKRGRVDRPGGYVVIDLDLSRYDRLHARFEHEAEEGRSFLKAGIATRNPRFNALIERIEEVAIRSREPILLLGPTGAGKSDLARRIHRLKVERGQVRDPFVEVNCATLRGENAMSALFGHVRGAFTGAVSARAGLLRRAEGGTLFLDEIGELGLDEQAMLLRAVEEGVFLPVGSDTEASSTFQLLAGTNRELRGEVAAGRFREDLMARIDLWTFALPALAERPEDIEPNLDHELTRIERDQGRRVSFSREARRRFLGFATGPRGIWKGNFRDFGAAIRRMATLAPGGRIGRRQVDEEIARLEAAWAAVTPPSDTDALLASVLDADARAALDRFDAVQLAEVIRVCRQSPSLSAAGRVLFAASRARRTSTNDADRLRKYLARLELTFASVGGGPDRQV